MAAPYRARGRERLVLALFTIGLIAVFPTRIHAFTVTHAQSRNRNRRGREWHVKSAASGVGNQDHVRSEDSSQYAIDGSMDSHSSPLSYTIDELGKMLGGQGRAKLLWDYYRRGSDPLLPDFEMKGQKPGQSIGKKTITLLLNHFGGSIADKVARLTKKSVSDDGTTKLLLELVKDGLQVETVIIPWSNRKRSTLCVSSQIGCRQACTFCLTGRMGILRNLSAEEIIAQFWWAQQIVQGSDSLFPIDNVVFMGMGEPADNADNVVRAAQVLADPFQFQLAPRRITISTVAPNPEAFATLSQAPAVLAWSVHSSREDIRRKLVPTTNDSMIELRQGLIDAVKNRPSRRLRAIMLEIALIDQINDSVEDARHLVEFCRPFMDGSISGLKLVVNLIPWNDIQVSLGPAAQYRSPKRERVLDYQKTLQDAEIKCHIRTTRGDDESAACGQLATTEQARR